MKRIVVMVFAILFCPIIASGYSLSYNQLLDGGYDYYTLIWNAPQSEYITWLWGDTWFYMPESITVTAEDGESDAVEAVISCSYYVDLSVQVMDNYNFSDYDFSFSVPNIQPPESTMLTIPVNTTVDLNNTFANWSPHVDITIDDYPVPIDPTLDASTTIYGQIAAYVDVNLLEIVPVPEPRAAALLLTALLAIVGLSKFSKNND